MRKYFKNKRKLLYKKCLNFRTNVQYRKRLLLFKFKKRKWESFLDSLRRTDMRRGSNYKLYDVTRHSISYYSFLFSKNYKRVLHNIRKIIFYYGGLKKQFQKKICTRGKNFGKPTQIKGEIPNLKKKYVIHSFSL